MNSHLRCALLVAALVGVGVVLWLLRHVPAVRGDSTLRYDILLGVLGAGIVATVVSYVLTLRRKAVAAPEGETSETAETESTPRRALLVERLLGKKGGRVFSIVLLSVIGVAVLFLVAVIGYIVFFSLFSGP